MCKYRAHVFRIDSRVEQRLLRVQKMFVRILLVVVVMQITDSHPVLFILSEVLGHGAHCGHYVKCMESEMFLSYHSIIKLFCSFKCKHFPNPFLIGISSELIELQVFLITVWPCV